MARNKLTDLNNHLFAQIERLSDDDLTPEELYQEVAKGQAISRLAFASIKISKTTIDAMRLVAQGEYTVNELPEMIGMPPRQKPNINLIS